MFWLLLSTGFTGGMTFLFVIRWIIGWLMPPPALDVHFSPKGGCADRVVNEIDKAHREVLVLAYSFTSKVITGGADRRPQARRDGRSRVGPQQRKGRPHRPGTDRKRGLKPLVDAHTRHRPQQGHGHRPPDGPDRQLQLHQPGRARKRGEPAGATPPSRLGRRLPAEFRAAPRPRPATGEARRDADPAGGVMRKAASGSAACGFAHLARVRAAPWSGPPSSPTPTAAPRCGWPTPPRLCWPPLRLDEWFSFLPRPLPDFLPPPVSLLTVAQARRSASFSDVPRRS